MFPSAQSQHEQQLHKDWDPSEPLGACLGRASERNVCIIGRGQLSAETLDPVVLEGEAQPSEMGVSHQEHDYFTPLLGSAEPSSLLEWGCDVLLCSRAACSLAKILWWCWKRYKIKPNCLLRWLLQNAFLKMHHFSYHFL